MQDKRATMSAREALLQPLRSVNTQRALTMNNNPSRSQNSSIPKEKAEQLTLWVKPIVKAEFQWITKKEDLSVSATGSAFLECALQQRVDLQYGMERRRKSNIADGCYKNERREK